MAVLLAFLQILDAYNSKLGLVGDTTKNEIFVGRFLEAPIGFLKPKGGLPKIFSVTAGREGRNARTLHSSNSSFVRGYGGTLCTFSFRLSHSINYIYMHFIDV